MRPLGVIVIQPFVQINLQSFNAFIQLFAERNLVEFLQDRLVEPLADTVGLGRFHLGLGVFDIPSRACEHALPGSD